MLYKVILDTQAEDDVTETALWYEEKQAGFGKQFVLRFEEVLTFLQKNQIFLLKFIHISGVL